MTTTDDQRNELARLAEAACRWRREYGDELDDDDMAFYEAAFEAVPALLAERDALAAANAALLTRCANAETAADVARERGERLAGENARLRAALRHVRCTAAFENQYVATSKALVDIETAALTALYPPNPAEGATK